jgi:hypothetical protein
VTTPGRDRGDDLRLEILVDDVDTTDEDGLAPDRYLRQLRPAAEAPDAVVRQTGEHAAHGHGVARGERP